MALVGDGGLGMTMAELETAVRVGARVVVVVFDNERYGTIRMWQERRGTGVGVATELGPIDFAAIARACGARGVRVERDGDFEPALAGRARRRPGDGHPARARPTLAVDRRASGLIRPTFHLVPAATWDAVAPGSPYTAPRSRTRASSSAPTASMPWGRRSTAPSGRPRPFVALTVDLDALDVPWRFDVVGSPYPHIYGPIARRRDHRRQPGRTRPDGRFVRLGVTRA